jgi:hypothetical protein
MLVGIKPCPERCIVLPSGHSHRVDDPAELSRAAGKARRRGSDHPDYAGRICAAPAELWSPPGGGRHPDVVSADSPGAAC